MAHDFAPSPALLAITQDKMILVAAAIAGYIALRFILHRVLYGTWRKSPRPAAHTH